MGTGPFVFVEYVRGSHWLGRKNPNYWDKDKPYLDSYRGVVTIARSAQVAAIRSERAMIQFGSFAPAEVAQVVDALGSRVTVQEAPWNCLSLVAINQEKKPFDDKRVRRALTLALDRHQAAQALSRIAYVKEVAGVEVPGSPFATPPAELEQLAGYGRDVNRAREEARKLLREAGLGSGFSFTLKNRSIPMPYEPIGIWLTDQWRQIGVTVRHQPVESGAYFADLRGGNFEVAHDFRCGYIVEPDLDLSKFLSHENNSTNYSRFNDKILGDLYQKQSRSTDATERKAIIRAFERRLVDEEAHYLPIVQWHRFVPHSAKLRGYTVTPSNYLNQQLDTIWLAQ
jgi:peptide/nickel transport system substrate-binding protein